MSFARELVTEAAIGVGIAENPAGLRTLHRPGCAAVIWRRQPPVGFQSWIDAMDVDLLPQTQLFLAPGKIAGAMDTLCAKAGMPAGEERDWLARDIATLAELFSWVMPAPLLRLRLIVGSTYARPKFHVDETSARLICTYRGPGTQYGVSINGADPTKILTIPTGAPAILRGKYWPEGQRSGVLHRSPPTVAMGETRFLLILDPVAGPANA
ncbi:MAG: DUF1826 domain-containing protein [Pseudomonadota bacterium]